MEAQYFQQHVDYTISVTLDTKRHVLRGNWEMSYQNNSPDTLYSIFLHLYPNAYSSRSTAFAKQQLRLGITDFRFALQADLGKIDSLSFTVDNQSIPWSLDKDNPDIATLFLPFPLLPGQHILVSSPMRVQIPKAYSRMGRIDDSYQLTQWYPKPAVYDSEGWHPMPYLNQGEFYGEFGSFDVTITLPETHIVAATGVLQTPEAIRRLDSLAQSRNPPLSVSPTPTRHTRIWHYRAAHVHDFAWFADTRFAVRKITSNIEGSPVDCWAFFTTVEQELWEHATDYISDALQFYSKYVGLYPHPQVTAVQVPLGRDFGMEYPMITSINLAGDAKTLDDVLAHEVGHNWFYGVLGSNERKHPWMDEGINTYYEFAYLREKYQAWSEHILLYKPANPDGMSDEQRIMQHMTRGHQLVAPDSDPEYQSEMQNFFGAYFKPALAFHMLQKYLGDKLFEDAMHAYYDTWKFRHPQPADLRKILTEQCGCDLGWLFEGVLGTDELIDYRIREFDAGEITIENAGHINAPIHLIAFRDSQIIYEKWFEGFEGQKEFKTDIKDADRIQVYQEIYTLDGTPSDNVLLLSRNRKSHSKIRLRLFGGKAYSGEQYLNLSPVVGWNETDGGLFGLALSNTSWPPGKLQWAVAPLYSSNTSTLAGAGEIQYKLVSDNRSQSLELGFGIKSFHFAEDAHYGFYDRYLKIAPRIRFGFGDRKLPGAPVQYFQYRFIYVHQKYGRGIHFDDFIWEEHMRSYAVHEVKYARERKYGLVSEHLEGILHLGKGFLRISADARQKISYSKPQKALYLHAFAGALPYYDSPKANVNFNLNGIQSSGFYSRDYLYDELLVARNATSGMRSQLVFLKDAQVKTLYNGGMSDRWMVAAGVATDTPLPIPVMPYFDVALYHDPFDNGTALSFSGGLAFVVLKDVCEIYVPLVESKDIRNSLTYLDRNTIFKRISILVDLKKLHPFQYKGYSAG